MDRNEYLRKRYARQKKSFKPVTTGEMICKKCDASKSVLDFGTHPNMANGRRTTCKICRSQETIKWFKNGGNKLRTIERQRKYKKQQREKFPEKYAARNDVMNAIASGKLVAKTSCERCGSKELLHGHHVDYSMPLEVEWLCVPCHTKEHLVKE